MTRLLGMLIATLMIGTSQASTSHNGNVLSGNPTVTVIQPRTATRNVVARVKIQKPKILVGHPHKVTVNDWDDDFLDIDDIITSYRRRDLSKIEHPDGISEKVRWRLFLARQLAIMKYREIHS